MTLALIALLLTILVTAPAIAAPGDPRFVQGTLEWPAALTREPLIIVRGDDGHAYYCDVTDAARHRADGLRAGGRLSVLGIEAAKPHELMGIVIGTGDAAALARALSQSLSKQVPAPASPPAALASAVASAPAGVRPAAADEPAAPTPPAAPAPSTAPAVVIMAPSMPVTPAVAAAPTPAVVAASATPPAVTAPPPAPRRAVVPAIPTTGGRSQWSRLDGVVESVAGLTLTLKTDEGALAYVDISQLSPNVAQVLRQGTAVTVYGYPLEQRFEAQGYVQTHPAGPESRAPGRPAR
jgi:hypothetical protein